MLLKVTLTEHFIHNNYSATISIKLNTAKIHYIFFFFFFCYLYNFITKHNATNVTYNASLIMLFYTYVTYNTGCLCLQYNTEYSYREKKKRKKIKSYKRNLYMVLKFVRLLLRTAISRCILIFSLRSVRKQSKQSFFSCKQLLYMKYFAIRSE